MSTDWVRIEKLHELYRQTAGKALNVERFSHYAITHHSTRIEGSTLTQEETNVLLEKGTSVGGKPIEHQNMVLDHYEALQFVLESAKRKRPLSVEFIQEIASRVMRRTGKEINAMLGNTDEKKGDFRKVNVSAGGHYFVDASKVVGLTKQLVATLNERLAALKSTRDILSLGYVAHFDLVSIHPFSDGNGRTSRLLMNYIEALHDMPLTIVNSEDRVKYIEALKATREKKDTSVIIDFMASQHAHMLSSEIQAYKSSLAPSRGKGDSGYSMIF